MVARADRDNFILAANALMQTQVGQQYFAALKALADNAQRELVFAPPEFLSYAQGVARTYTTQVEDMQSAKEKAAKILAAEESAKQRS